MVASIVKQYTEIKKLHQGQTLAKKLADIGALYLQNYPTPEYFGPFYFHTNQLLAKLLTQLSESSDQHAYNGLMATLYALPRQGMLSQMLIDCISQHPVMSIHQPQNQAHYDTYHGLICDNAPTGGFIASIAGALFAIDHPENRLQAVPAVGQPRSISDRLADIGEKYLAKYPQSTSTLVFFNRHTQQHQAHLLAALRGLGDDAAIVRGAQILAGLSKGELSGGIIQEVSNHMDIIEPKEKIGSFEQQFAEAMLDGLNKQSSPGQVG